MIEEELAYHKTKDKGTLSLSRRKNGGYVVARYSASDIEEWSVEYADEGEAFQAFRRACEET